VDGDCVCNLCRHQIAIPTHRTGPEGDEEASKPVVRHSDKQKAQWLKPGLIVRVRFLRGEEKLRHATEDSAATTGAWNDKLLRGAGEEAGAGVLRCCLVHPRLGRPSNAVCLG
jgi:hypothetical protein